MKTEFAKETKTNWGYQDGKNSATMNNPIHNNWKDAHGRLTHYDEAYTLGYILGYKEITGVTLVILIKE